MDMRFFWLRDRVAQQQFVVEHICLEKKNRHFEWTFDVVRLKWWRMDIKNGEYRHFECTF